MVLEVPESSAEISIRRLKPRAHARYIPTCFVQCGVLCQEDMAEKKDKKLLSVGANWGHFSCRGSGSRGWWSRNHFHVLDQHHQTLEKNMRRFLPLRNNHCVASEVKTFRDVCRLFSCQIVGLVGDEGNLGIAGAA